MEAKHIYFDISRCVGCFTCQVACKQENDLAPKTLDAALAQNSPVWRRVIKIEKGEYGKETIDYISLSCMHCADAPCISACPNNAISKTSNESVIVDKNKCIGCKMCMLACPFGIPQYGIDGIMQKCNLCISRVEKGEEPACVAACPSKALTYGTPTEISKKVQQKIADKLVFSTGRSYKALPLIS